MSACITVPRSRSSSGNVTNAEPSVAYSLPSPDEQVAIGRTLSGDIDAFNELVLMYQPLAFSVAVRMLQSREGTADAVQDSFIKAFCALHSFSGNSFKAWLIRIVVNSCYDILHLNRQMTIEEINDGPDYEDGVGISYQLIDTQELLQAFVERMELCAQIELGIRDLSNEQRILLVLRDIHGCSYEEISEITGLVIGTVKSRISRARVRLRSYLLSQLDQLATVHQDQTN